MLITILASLNFHTIINIDINIDTINIDVGNNHIYNDIMYIIVRLPLQQV